MAVVMMTVMVCGEHRIFTISKVDRTLHLFHLFRLFRRAIFRRDIALGSFPARHLVGEKEAGEG